MSHVNTLPVNTPPHHGSLPRYAFCQRSFATEPHHHHIRELGDDGLHRDGGLDSVALCGEHVDRDIAEVTAGELRRLESAADRSVCPVCAVGAA